MVDFIGFPEGEKAITWEGITDALLQGHKRAKAEVADTFLYRGSDTLLSRAAWIDGLGQAVKTATVFPGNHAFNKPSIHGSVSLFSDQTGELDAVLDFHLVTKWKTAGDSLLAAKLLASTNPQEILIVGAGTVASSMIDAYRSLFPNAVYSIWNRTAEKAKALADAKYANAVVDLGDAVQKADIICTATMSKEPVIKGDWLRNGQHLDLIGAYRPDMRELDDAALKKARIFVDNRHTTMDHIGELKIPLSEGVISPDDVLADFYEADTFSRAPDDITICKNGGGAHLDLMTCRYIYDAWKSA